MMDKQSVCSQCGQDPTPYASVTFASSDNLEAAERICGRCAAMQHVASIESVDEIDECIADTADQIETMERVLTKAPQMSAIPDALSAFAVTPMNLYRTLQYYLAAFNSRRIELIQAMDSEQRLQYEYQRAIRAEDYERAATIKQELDRE